MDSSETLHFTPNFDASGNWRKQVDNYFLNIPFICFRRLDLKSPTPKFWRSLYTAIGIQQRDTARLRMGRLDIKEQRHCVWVQLVSRDM